ncbi:metal ABC transporter solute-binding protein, Zn/Mn family [Staphylococcus simiae]|uniref:ABC transport system, permease protein n=1 Tax=Staphylococcus simiae CCM 7213 = CCUG 51256 TaxID=911238 RepID=G5JHK5_9STAP|nr:zinc ABC transporter substrate-binding protein [Staphylococcus simiae]EHJ08338.1 ABC transport system, permease protein [Staphylococcus simiae CCM 7213 = CCUG 51256]PNZ13857.1 zinc ABC transporter substrate-binding protein [Staphylococcus simiae]SNV59866.1 manganese ABC transporter periplasmic-binding protein SitA [Staphylococcus simiae]
MKKLVLFTTLIALLLILVACGNEPKSKVSTGEVDKDKIQVVTSFSMLEDMAKKIGGKHVDVHNLAPIGTDPHEYEPKPEDIKHIEKADLILYNGLNLEGGNKGWLAKAMKTTNYPTENAIETGKKIKPQYLKDDDGHKEVNPHAFIDPHAGEVMVKATTQAFIDKNPNNKAYYKKNEAAYLKELHQIEQDYQQQLGSIPKQDRILVTSEQAFQYLTSRYDFKEGYIWPIDTEENGSPEQLKGLIRFIKQYNPKVLFIESNVDKRPMQTVSEETGVPIYHKPIYSDEIGRKGHEGDTYLSYLKYNLKVLTDGLKSKH